MRNPILIPSSSYPKSHRKLGDKSVQIRLPLPFTQYFHKLHTTHMNYPNLNNKYFFPNSCLRTLTYDSISRHQFIIEFKMNFFKIMFRIPYPVQIKILIFNQLKIFNSLLSSVYPIYKLLILDGFLKF